MEIEWRFGTEASLPEIAGEDWEVEAAGPSGMAGTARGSLKGSPSRFGRLGVGSGHR
jgi:hypothetical protein